MGRKVTHEEFVDRVSKVNPDITIVGEYKGSREKTVCVKIHKKLKQSLIYL